MGILSCNYPKYYNLPDGTISILRSNCSSNENLGSLRFYNPSGTSEFDICEFASQNIDTSNVFVIYNSLVPRAALNTSLVWQFLSGDLTTINETIGYDYNNEHILDIGDISSRNDPIDNKIVSGQMLNLSIYDINCSNAKTFTTTINSSTSGGTSTSRDRSVNYQSYLGSVNEGDNVYLTCTASQSTIISNTFTVIGGCHRWVVYYLNKYGGIDHLIMRGNIGEQSWQEGWDNDKYEIKNNYDRSGPNLHQYQTISNISRRQLILSTNDLTNAQSSKMDNLIYSPRIFVHDLSTMQIIAATISSPNDYTVNKRKVNNTELNNYQITFSVAWDSIRRG